MEGCSYCDTALTRVAVLALRLRKVSIEAHKQRQHKGEWPACEELSCAEDRRILRYGGLARTSKDDDG